MPELPEVETVRRGLDQVLPGRVVTSLQVTGRRSVRRQRPRELSERAVGRRVERADRRGKYLALVLDDGQVLVVHLRMSGQLLHVVDPAGTPIQQHTHVVMGLDDGSELRFVDPRTFGEWYVTGEVGPGGLPLELERLGPDPLTGAVGVAVLRERLSHRRSALKAALTDQHVIAGIGNIYADEICHVAKLRPDRRCETLTGDELRTLRRAISSVLRAAVKSRGSTLRDSRYRDLMGEAGSYQRHHKVYGRAGESCRRCGATVEKLRIGARVAYCCTSCQR